MILVYIQHRPEDRHTERGVTYNSQSATSPHTPWPEGGQNPQGTHRSIGARTVTEPCQCGYSIQHPFPSQTYMPPSARRPCTPGTRSVPVAGQTDDCGHIMSKVSAREREHICRPRPDANRTHVPGSTCGLWTASEPLRPIHISRLARPFDAYAMGFIGGCGCASN